MRIFQRIRNWFRRIGRSDAVETPEEMETQATTQAAKPILSMEVKALLEEHQHLEAERQRLRKEIDMIDAQHAANTISAGERDRAYRTRLARAGQISLQQMAIKNRLVGLNHPIPLEWRGARRHQ